MKEYFNIRVGGGGEPDKTRRYIVKPEAIEKQNRIFWLWRLKSRLEINEFTTLTQYTPLSNEGSAIVGFKTFINGEGEFNEDYVVHGEAKKFLNEVLDAVDAVKAQIG